MTTLILPPKDREARIASASRAMATLYPGRKVRVEITEYRPERSDAQNASLWGVAYPPLMEFMGLRGEREKQELHETLCGEFFGWAEYEIMGVRKRKPLRTTTRDSAGKRDVIPTVEMQRFYEFVQQKGAEIGVYVPSPNEYEVPA